MMNLGLGLKMTTLETTTLKMTTLEMTTLKMTTLMITTLVMTTLLGVELTTLVLHHGQNVIPHQALSQNQQG